MEDLILKIAENLPKEPTKYQVYEDLYQVAREALKTDKNLGVKWLRWLSEKCAQIIPVLAQSDLAVARGFFSLHKQVLLAAAQEDFDSYLQYIEWNREPSKKFYVPRRKILKQVVDALQALADDELDLLAISLPPGVGKNTLAIFFLTWLAGKIPDKPMLTGSHSNSFVRGVYADDTSFSKSLSYKIATGYSAYYIKSVGLDTNGNPHIMLPCDGSGGTETTYMCDVVWTDTGWRLFRRGGNWVNGSKGGLFTASLDSTSSNYYSHVGARLLYIPS